MFIVTDKNDTFANTKESKSLKNQITGEELKCPEHDLCNNTIEILRHSVRLLLTKQSNYSSLMK